MRRTISLILVALALALAFAGSGVVAQMPKPIFDLSKSFVTAAGSTYGRLVEDLFGDTINPLFYGGNQRVDRTGVLDTSDAFRAAEAAACSFSPPRGLRIPAGIYAFYSVVAGGCSDLSFDAEVPGTVTFRISGATATNAAGQVVTTTPNTSAPGLFVFTAVDRIKFHGIKFDGPNSDNNNGAVTINGPSIGLEFDTNVFRDMQGTGIWMIGGPPIIAGFLSADATGGVDTTMTLTTLDSRVHKGAYFLNEIDPDIYIAAEPVGTTITLNKAITDSSLKNTRINVTPAFTLTADTLAGDTFLVSHTDGLLPKQTIYSPQAPCVIRGTRIKSIVANTSVTLEKNITCPVRSGTSFAATVGFQRPRFRDNKFEELGMGLATGRLVVYTTAAATLVNTNTLTLACVSGIKCAQVGLVPGNMTWSANLPPGVGPNNPVVDQVSINNAAGTYVVRFRDNFTAPIAAGVQIPFSGPQNSGKGYAIWSGYGAPFANLDYSLSGGFATHTWSSPYFIWFTQGTKISNEIYSMDMREFASPTVAPSACIAASGNIDLTIENISCRGATGIGLELNHNIRMHLSNIHTSYNGGPGAYVCGGHDVDVVNYFAFNNGQIQNFPRTQQFDLLGYGGLQVSGSCTYGRVGILTNLLLSNLHLFDDQIGTNGLPAPTQTYGIAQWDHNAIINNLVLGPYIVTGNKLFDFDPNLGLNPPPAGTVNLIVNPCAAIDQRNEGASLITASGYGPDQWMVLSSPAHISYQRVSASMGGCSTGLKMTVASSFTPLANSFSYTQQFIEAASVGVLKYGTASAKNIIADFCISAPTAGTYAWGMQNHFAGHLRAYASSYVLTAANTVQCFSKLVPGDQVAGFSGVTGAAGLGIEFDAGSGSNFYTPACDQWADITSNTGFFCNNSTPLVTLAAGQSITVSAVRVYQADSDQLPWVQKTPEAEQAAANRFFTKTFLAQAPAQNAGLIGALCGQNPVGGATQDVQYVFPTPMRTTPTVTLFNPSAANALGRDVTAGVDVVATANPDGSADALQTLIRFAATPANDNSCVQATFSASY